MSVNRPAICSWSRAEASRLTSMSCVIEGDCDSSRKLSSCRSGHGGPDDHRRKSCPTRVGYPPSDRPAQGLRHMFEEPRRLLERLLVLPEPHQLAAERQDGPEVDGRSHVLFPTPLEHQGGVEDHQADRKEQRQGHHHDRGEISQPMRFV